ncbi:MAG: ferredoxin, partial [Clostridia bacterium]|nr:ferredoxin [Clostridia bacterium]
GVCFISPCPAKVSYVKNSTSTDVGMSSVDVVVSIREIYFLLIDLMDGGEQPEHFTESGMIGISWDSTGGESSAIFNEKYLAADGIENVIKVLDQIENAEFTDLEFVELNACPGGCVGGVMTVANPYIAKARLQSLKRYLPVSPNWVFDKEEIPTSAVDLTELTYTPAGALSESGATAMQMMAKIQEIRRTLPDIDCGFCGAPTCAAFAEDVVRGEAHPDDCILRLREKLGTIPDTMGFEPENNGGGK